MAKIVKSSVQLEALKEVNDKIKLVQKIDEFLKYESVLGLKRDKLKITLTDNNVIKKVLITLKRDTLHQIDKKCSKYSIELDEKERKMLDKELMDDLDESDTENKNLMKDENLIDKTEDLVESTSEIENENLVKENEDLTESEDRTEIESLEIKGLEDDARLDYVYDLENDEIIK